MKNSRINTTKYCSPDMDDCAPDGELVHDSDCEVPHDSDTDVSDDSDGSDDSGESVIKFDETSFIHEYEYEIVDDIKIYNSVKIEGKDKLLESIDTYKKLYIKIFSDIQPSTLTCKGHITNILFTEEKLIDKLPIPDFDCTIVKIGCNYGEIIKYPNPFKKYSIYNLIDMIVKHFKLERKYHLSIRCNCSDVMAGINAIYDKIMFVRHNDGDFTTVCDKVYKKLDKDHYLTKKVITRLSKNVTLLMNYNTLTDDEVAEIYRIMELAISNKRTLDFVMSYIDGLIDIVSYFMRIENACVCIKAYTDMYGPIIALSDKKIKSSTRGRKPKKKKKSIRKIQGMGTYFSSQMTFEVYSRTYRKIYKIKLFRNGNFQIPGVKDPKMIDLKEPLRITVKYLKYAFNHDNMRVVYMLSVMRNYKCRIINQDVFIILNNLEEVLATEKGLVLKDQHIGIGRMLGDIGLYEHMFRHVMYYANNTLGAMCEISNNTEQYPGLLIKFNKPLPNKKNKKMTVKVLTSGKINFDGANSELEVYEVYYWIQFIFNKYWDEIIFDRDNIKYKHVVDETVASDCESIYDDDEELLTKYGLN